MKSKAQLKREKDLINGLTRTMNRQLRTFKNQYIGDFVNYEVNQIQRFATAFKNTCLESVSNHVIGKSFDSIRKSNCYTNTELQLFNREIIDNEHCYEERITSINKLAIECAKKRMETIELEKIDFYAEANKSFESKLNKLILKMVSSGIFNNNIGLNIERVGNAGNDFEILVYPKTRISRWKGDIQLTDEQVKQAEIDATEKFFHARMIYACGEIVKPHFRFITTTRKSYI